jgi:hypothetical protein
VADPLAFEKSFPPERRRFVADAFLNVIRNARIARHEADANDAIAGVIAHANRQIEILQAHLNQCSLFPDDGNVHQADFEFWSGLVERLGRLDDELESYVLLRLQWDFMTIAEQNAARLNSKTGDVVPMTERPPSMEQMNYLRVMGYRGADPLTMAAASALINEFRARRTKKRVSN